MCVPEPVPRIAVFAKAPRPGYAKTRLIPRLGAAGAATLHAALVRHTLATVCAQPACETSLWCAPDTSDPFFAACAHDHAVRLHDQADGDLGARMHAALAALTADGRPAVVIGTDSPALDTARLAQAGAVLASGADAVFVPAEDGGYALVGLRRADARLFAGMRWSVSTVMADTRARLRALGWQWHELEPVWDVDTPADIDRLLADPALDAAIAAALTPAGSDRGWPRAGA